MVLYINLFFSINASKRKAFAFSQKKITIHYAELVEGLEIQLVTQSSKKHNLEALVHSDSIDTSQNRLQQRRKSMFPEQDH